MASPAPRPERATIGGRLSIPRIVLGLWQLAGDSRATEKVEAAVEAMAMLFDTTPRSPALQCWQAASPITG